MINTIKQAAEFGIPSVASSLAGLLSSFPTFTAWGCSTAQGIV